ncbi:MAG: hypothetical protein ACRDFX_08995 [Chloroflexota bacterium]
MSVYELDIDALMAQIEAELTRQGYKVTEQIPAGVWWFHSSKGEAEAADEIAQLFREVVRRQLLQIDQ